MIVLATILAAVCVSAGLLAFIKPYTKEKVFVLALGLVQVALLMLVAPPPPDAVSDSLSRTAEQRLQANSDQRFTGFVQQIRTEATTPPRRSAEGGAFAASTSAGSEIELVTSWTPAGPEFAHLTVRQPLGVLDPLPGQALPHGEDQ